MGALKKLLVGVAASVLVTSVWADDLNGVTLARKGVELSVRGTAQLTVPNDRASMVFRLTSDAPTLKVATNLVIDQMNAAQSLVKSLSDTFELQTQGFQSYPVYGEKKGDEAPKVIGWRVSQGLSVKTNDITQVSRVIEKVASTMALDHLSFGLKDETRKKLDEKLHQMAINDATQKAVWVAKSLGKDAKAVELKSLRFEGASLPRADYLMSAKAMNSASAAPQIEAGTSQLQFSVTADVVIRR